MTCRRVSVFFHQEISDPNQRGSLAPPLPPNNIVTNYYDVKVVFICHNYYKRPPSENKALVAPTH